MKKSCIYCGRTHDRGEKCPKAPAPVVHIYRKNKTTKDRFRSTAAWQKVRIAVVMRDNAMCALCLKEGHYGMPKTIEVHHIVSLEKDYSRRLDKTNLICLCPVHHKQADEGRIPAAELAEIAEERTARLCEKEIGI